MEQIIKTTRKLGNATGVVLPKKWENSLVKVEIIRKPLDEIELLYLLRELIDLEDIMGVYLVGSYARMEGEVKSDIDILVISKDKDLDIQKGRYQITIVSKKTLDIQKGYPYYYSLLKEARPIINKTLLEEYKKNLSLSKKGIQEYIKKTKLMIKKSEKAIKESEDQKEAHTYDAVAYSLILRLRGLYILDSHLNRNDPSNKKLIYLIKELTGSLDIYKRYLAVKNNEKLKTHSVSLNEAVAIIEYIKKGLKKWEEILKEGKKF